MNVPDHPPSALRNFLTATATAGTCIVILMAMAAFGHHDHHPGELVTFILERMRRTDGHVGEHHRRGNDSMSFDRDLAFENIKALLVAAVDVRRWATARRENCLPDGVGTVGIGGRCQEGVYIIDDGDAAAFG